MIDAFHGVRILLTIDEERGVTAFVVAAADPEQADRAAKLADAARLAVVRQLEEV